MFHAIYDIATGAMISGTSIEPAAGDHHPETNPSGLKPGHAYATFDDPPAPRSVWDQETHTFSAGPTPPTGNQKIRAAMESSPDFASLTQDQRRVARVTIHTIRKLGLA